MQKSKKMRLTLSDECPPASQPSVRKTRLRHGKDFELTDDELFNAYQTFADILVVNLKKLKKNAKGVPACLCVDKDCNILPIKVGQERWNKILDKIIWSFNEYANEYPSRPNFECELPSKEHQKYAKKLRRGVKLFYKWFEWFVYY